MVITAHELADRLYRLPNHEVFIGRENEPLSVSRVDVVLVKEMDLRPNPKPFIVIVGTPET